MVQIKRGMVLNSEYRTSTVKTANDENFYPNPDINTSRQKLILLSKNSYNLGGILKGFKSHIYSLHLNFPWMDWRDLTGGHLANLFESQILSEGVILPHNTLW